MQGEMTKELGVFEVELDGRFSSIRAMETNLGNFVCDIMVASTEADFALINSGTFRSDTLHPAGSFTIKDLLLILPMIDPLVLVEVSGSCKSYGKLVRQLVIILFKFGKTFFHIRYINNNIRT